MAIPSLRRSFKWTFVIAETVKPLLGIDFLHAFDLSVDCSRKLLTDSLTSRSVEVSSSQAEVNIIVNNVKLPSNVENILKKYPNLTSPHSNNDENYCGVYHRIDTQSHSPVFAKARQLSQQKYNSALNSFKKLQNDGIITQSDSEWSSPLHLVPKSNGEFRACGDYRALNSITKGDKYPIPNINSFSTKLANKSCFSKIDLTSAYHQIRVHPDDICKTAVVTPFGLFQYNNMPFGLKNAAATFQRMMDKIFSNISCVFTYIDDILIFSDDEASHLNDIESVFRVLNDNNLKISISKCIFNVSQLEFLGYNISIRGLEPSAKKVEELKSFSCPNDTQSLRRFLGMIGFYRKLIPNFADLTFPLTECIRLNPKAKSLEITDKERLAFDNIKNVLTNISALPHAQPDVTHYQLVTDSSSYAVGAALHQMVDSKPIPIGFFSKKLSQTQQRYSTFDRELLAAYLSVLYFKHHIEGRNVILLTDHKPLCNAFHSVNPSKSDRQQRHLSLLTEYISDVSYIRGSDNVVADCLSRPVNALFIDACDLSEISTCQSDDEEIKMFSDKLKEFKLSHSDKIILCDISTPYPRPFVPVSIRKNIFSSLHDISHPGNKATIKLIKARYFWPYMDKSIKEWCAECIYCQRSKIHKHVHSPIQNFVLPSERFQSVHLDIVGPLPAVQNRNDSYSSPYKYLLTMIDRSTRWLEAYPLSNITASNVAHAFVEGWVSRFGVPLHVITDRGTQFESEFFSELSKIVGFHRLRTTAYHPQCNGLIERAHRTLKNAIKAKNKSWLSSLPVILLGLRSIPNESGYSPFTAVTGTSVLLPQIMIDYKSNNDVDSSNDEINRLISDMAKLDLSALSSGKIHSNPKVYIPKDLFTCEYVWLRVDRVRRSLEAPYTGPYKVLNRTDKYFQIELPNNVHSNVSIDRIKPFVQCSSTVKPCKINKSKEILRNKSVVDNKFDVENKTIENNKSLINVKSRPTVTRSGRKISFKDGNEYHYY